MEAQLALAPECGVKVPDYDTKYRNIDTFRPETSKTSRMADAGRQCEDKALAVWMAPASLLQHNGATSDTPITVSPGNEPAAPRQGESFHEAVSGFLVAAQLLGLLPVSGVCNPDPRQLRFEFKSVRTVWAVMLIVIYLYMGLISLLGTPFLVTDGHAEDRGVVGKLRTATYLTVGVVFYGSFLVGAVLMLRLARRWPRLMARWADMEGLMRRGRVPKLKLRIALLCAFFMVGTLVEEVWQVLMTAKENDMSLASYFEGYSILFIIDELVTFTRVFIELFLAVVSMGLADRFIQFNSEITESEALNKVDWRKLREIYAALSSVTKDVDDNIGSLVLLFFGYNLYDICAHLLFIISGHMISIDDYYGLGFLLVRNVMVTLIMARINELSKSALPALFSCSSDNYTKEAMRLQHQMASEDLAFTGKGFFSITKQFLIAVVGAIITYYIMVLQFKQGDSSGGSSHFTNCSANCTI